MTKLVRKLSNVSGTSLLEILIALAMTGVVTTAIFKAYVTQHKNYLIQEDVTDILEEYINTIAGLRSLESESTQGLALIRAEFELEIDIESGRVCNLTRGTELRGEAYTPDMLEIVEKGGLLKVLEERLGGGREAPR